MLNNYIGTTYWITGLSGAGKTTIGNLLYRHIKCQNGNIVLLDGDILRQIFHNTDYTLEGRKKLALQYSGLCKMLNEQGIDVIICVVGMFQACRDWNRKEIQNYKEIYLKVNMEELIRRDQKQLYSRALKKEIDNVMGIDIPIEEPKKPDIIVDNSGKDSPENVLNIILNELHID